MSGKFEHSLCARPFLSAAVAHPRRSAGLVGAILVLSCLAVICVSCRHGLSDEVDLASDPSFQAAQANAKAFLMRAGITNAEMLDVAVTPDSFYFAYFSQSASNVNVQVLRRDGSARFGKP
jgi:hypothetical protein